MQIVSMVWRQYILLLQHHSHAVAQVLQGIPRTVHAVHQHPFGRNVVCRESAAPGWSLICSGSWDDADGLGFGFGGVGSLDVADCLTCRFRKLEARYSETYRAFAKPILLSGTKPVIDVYARDSLICLWTRRYGAFGESIICIAKELHECIQIGRNARVSTCI